MKSKFTLSVAAFFVGILATLFTYWIAGNEFERCHNLAFTFVMSLIVGCVAVCLLQLALIDL